VQRAPLLLAVPLALLGGAPRAVGAPPDEDDLRGRLATHGFENVAVQAAPGETVVWFENRIYRDELTALGAAALLAAPDIPPSDVLTLVPQNLGRPLLSLSAPSGSWEALVRGRVPPEELGRELRIGPGRPIGGAARERSSRGNADAAIRPLWRFELGRPDDVFQSTFSLAPEITMSPFSGTLLTGQLLIRVKNDLEPEASDVAPGRCTLSWTGWLPEQVLAAASAGIFPDDRWGVAAETARLFLDGWLELGAGGDLSGRLEFTKDAILYSPLESWSAFAQATGRAPRVDLEVRGSVARFLEGDPGVRLDVGRRFHEARVAFFGIKTEAATVGGMLLAFPLPVKRQMHPRRLRPVTVSAFPIEYRDKLGNIGRQLSHFHDVDWVRKGLLPTYVRNNLGDLRRADPGAAPARAAATEGEEGWLSLHGTSGLVVTPTAEVAPDATLRLGYSFMDAKWVPHGRGEFDNEIWFLNFGFLPRVEVTVRATVLPGSRLTRFDDAPIVDRMGSARLQLLRPGRFPGIALGVDDVRGTRYYHSLYAVGTQRVVWDAAGLDLRASVGFGSRALEARNHLLDGVFGGLETRVFRTVSFVADHDTEKWNAGVRVRLLGRISAQVAWLDLEIPSAGMGLLHRL
jgi:hypothetical protein